MATGPKKKIEGPYEKPRDEETCSKCRRQMYYSQQWVRGGDRVLCMTCYREAVMPDAHRQRARRRKSQI